MRLFVSNFKWIMLLSGLITCTMFLALVSPQASLKSTFGANMEGGQHTEIIVRNWGALIGLMGIMLIYGAFMPKFRNFVLVIAGSSKIIFIVLVLSLGQAYLGSGAAMPVIVDSVMVILYIVYLLLSRSTAVANNS